jgi:hypothetical protein
MANFYLYVFILLCFILAVSYYNTLHANNHFIETFDSNKQNFILLGDSILKNEAYVSNGKSIYSLLKKRTNGKTICLAADDSKIIDVYNQINNIPDDLNNNNTTIFLSIGGNNILSQLKNKEELDRDLRSIFNEYKKLIKSIQDTLPDANIVLVDIYYPDNSKYEQYHSIINEWNNKIYDYAQNSKNNISSVLKISTILTQKDDFTNDIEPSSKGGKKLIESILASY